MHIYRYRPSGLLSQKELLYDEMYFSSKEELNDPIEMQSKFEFIDPSGDIWHRLLTRLWSDSDYAKVASEYLSSQSPIYYEELLDNYKKHEKSIIELVIKSTKLTISDFQILNNLLNELHSFLSLYEPSSGYSVSFSKSNNEMLMWSHYAKKHTGYCLIFRPIDGVLNQCVSRSKDRIFVSKGHSSCVPFGFKLEDIHYDNQIKTIDAFKLLPSPYTGYVFETEKDRLNHHADISTQLLTKNECWESEKESRILLPQPGKWISGVSSYSSCQRLFYYDFRQVVGIIFGARMPREEKMNIRDIIESKLSSKYSSINSSADKNYIFDFLFQESKICSFSRSLKIVDLELNTMGKIIDPGSDYYLCRLEKWKNFEGMTIESGKFSYNEIP